MRFRVKEINESNKMKSVKKEAPKVRPKRMPKDILECAATRAHGTHHPAAHAAPNRNVGSAALQSDPAPNPNLRSPAG